MANKLTKEKLKLLIEQMLNEKKISDKIGGGQVDDNSNAAAFKKKFGSSFPAMTPQEFKALSAEDGNVNDFSASDLYNAFREPTSAEYQTALKFNKAKQTYKDAVSGSLAAAVSGLNLDKVQDMSAIAPRTKVKAVKATDIDSIAFKSLQTVSADPEKSTDMGKFPEGLSTAINTVFSGDNSFSARIEKVSSLTSLIYKKMDGGYKDNAAAIEQQYQKSSDFLATVMFLDYLTTLVREIDSGAAAYQFESFLAMLSGGRVRGKESGPGGGMGATDFETNTGQKGSAKYVKNVSLSKVKQSAAGFVKNEPYVYIIAHKKDKSGGNMSDPRKIASIDIYMLSLITPDLVNFIIKNSKGEYIYRKVKGDGQIQLGGIGTALVNPLTLILQGDQKYAKSLNKQLSSNIQNNLQTKKQTAINAYKNISKNSYIADEKLKAYMASGKVKAGNEALEAMIEVEKGISEITTAFAAKSNAPKTYTQQIKKGIGGATLEENKKNQTKSLKDLDKLIERVILESMNKK